jgi:branched-chain amino acid transport system substrate-binding protein
MTASKKSGQHNEKQNHLSGGSAVLSKPMISAIVSPAIGALAGGSAYAQNSVKIGLIVSMTGEQASTGRQVKAGVDLYMKEHGNKVADKTIQVILRDSGSVPDHTKRLTQELIVNDKVNIIAGFGGGCDQSTAR